MQDNLANEILRFRLKPETRAEGEDGLGFRYAFRALLREILDCCCAFGG